MQVMSWGLGQGRPGSTHRRPEAKWNTILLFSPLVGKAKAPGLRNLGSLSSYRETESMRAVANPYIEMEPQPTPCSDLPARQVLVSVTSPRPAVGQTCRKSGFVSSNNTGSRIIILGTISPKGPGLD